MKKNHLRIIGVIFASVLGSVLLTSQDAFALLLVQDGQPRATIIVASDASPQVKQAAETLQQYIAQSSGATLPISATAQGNAISVGETPAVKEADIKTRTLDQDGFLLQSIDAKNYAIVGGSDWGTEFGVYDFLERYLGVRWLMPTDLYTDVPHHNTINIPDTKIIQQPTFLSRQLGPVYIEMQPKLNPLARWGRFNRARGRIAFGENLLNLFPVSQFGKTHPEFYPMLNGKRYIPSDDHEYHWQPNLSAPGIVDAAVEQIDKYFQEHPEATSYSLGMNDADAWDQSAASKAQRSGKKNYLGYDDVSDEYFTWANAVVAKVLLKYPDKWFGTLAYMNLSEPPTKVKLNPRIVPFMTYDRMRWADPKLRDIGHRITEEWSKAASSLGWYDYIYGLNYLLPRVYPHEMQQYLSWGAAHHVDFSYAEFYPNWGEGPKGWILTKLLWNPNQNVDALLDDWYTHFAGTNAAPKLKDYYAIWEKFWTQDIFKSKWNHDDNELLFFSGPPNYLLDVPQSYIDQSDADLEAALQLADTPQRKARVAQLIQMWDFYKASIITYQGEYLAGQSDGQSETQMLHLLDSAETVLEQAKKRKDLLSAFRNEPLYASSVEYLTKYPSTNGNSWGTSMLWRALPQATKNQKVKARLEQLAKNPGTAQEQAKLLLQAANGKFTSVSSNASFEDGATKWSFWDKADEANNYHRGIWSVTTDQAHSGTHSLLIEGLQRGGAVQSIPYQPGNYFARAYCYVPEIDPKEKVTLVLSILDSSGKVLGTEFVLPSSEIVLKPGAWRDTIVPFTVPKDSAGQAASIRILVTADNFEPDRKVYLDDLGIYRAVE